MYSIARSRQLDDRVSTSTSSTCSSRALMTSNSFHSVKADGLYHHYDDCSAAKPILQNISLSVGQGTFCMLKGISGCGKSTLLAILAGLLKPSQGRLEVLGTDLWCLNDVQREAFRLRHFGFVFQSCHLFPALTARQQLELVLYWGEGEAGARVRSRVNEMLERLNLHDKADRRPAQLSGGERQRVAIGRALVKRPAICFADEPTSALDPVNAEEAMRLFQNAARDLGTTVILISHDERLERFADRTWLLKDGRLQTTQSSPRASSSSARPHLPR